MRAEHPRAKRETRPFSKKKNTLLLYMFWACYSFSLREAEAGMGSGGGGCVVVCSRSLCAGEYIYRSGEPFPIRGDKWM